jgi:hypothetical protein
LGQCMPFDFQPRRAFLEPLVQFGRKPQRHWVCVLWHRGVGWSITHKKSTVSVDKENFFTTIDDK